MKITFDPPLKLKKDLYHNPPVGTIFAPINPSKGENDYPYMVTESRTYTPIGGPCAGTIYPLTATTFLSNVFVPITITSMTVKRVEG